MPREFTKEEFDRIRSHGWDVTTNSVWYDWGFAGSDGAWFCLIREPHHTDDDIINAKAELRMDRDVVSMSVGKLENNS